jgi:hypothetical protein
MPLRMRQLHIYCKRRNGYVNRPIALIEKFCNRGNVGVDAIFLAFPLCLTLCLGQSHNGI